MRIRRRQATVERFCCHPAEASVRPIPNPDLGRRMTRATLAVLNDSSMAGRAAKHHSPMNVAPRSMHAPVQ